MRNIEVNGALILTHQSQNIVYIALESDYLLWLSNARQFVMLKEPAFYVVSQFISGADQSVIIQDCANRYQLEPAECKAFVSELVEQFSALLAQSFDPVSSVLSSPVQLPEMPHVFHFRFNDLGLSISSQSLQINELFEPLFSHLLIKMPDSSFEQLYLYRDKNFLTIADNQSSERFASDDYPHFKGALFGKILNAIYRKDDTDWMMTMHASGISQRGQSVLFSASAGSGKSTIAALMHAHGYQLLSDDFIAVDRHGFAYFFDMAISVKTGSVDLLSEYFNDIKSISPRKWADKTVRYLPPKNEGCGKGKSEVKAIVFVNYYAESAFSFQQLTSTEALQRLLPEVFVTPIADAVKDFMNFVSKTDFYTLTYSDTTEALSVVQKIFDNER